MYRKVIIILILGLLILTALFVIGNSLSNKLQIKVDKSSERTVSDLSYIIIVTDEKVTSELVNQDSNTIYKPFVQQSLTDPQTGTKNGQPISQTTVTQPSNGIYNLTLSSPENFKATILIYDKKGDSIAKEISGHKTVKYKISFNKEDSSLSNIYLE